MVLEMENVQKHYDEFSLNCSLNLQPGRITGVIGPNGAGKTTLFKSILGLISVDNGRVKVFGKDVQLLTSSDREKIGVVWSDAGFSGYLTVKDIATIMDNLYTRFDKTAFIKQCKEFGLPMDKKLKEFSTGMKAQLKVLAAMSYGAKVLILDEPTAGLDVIARDKILDSVRSYMEHEERAILISSHISSDLETLCDDLYLIDKGSLVLHEETDVLLSNYGVLKVTDEQYANLDKQYLLRHKKESFGQRCLTDQKQFYLDNNPEIVMEKGNIDEVITLMIGGEEV